MRQIQKITKLALTQPDIGIEFKLILNMTKYMIKIMVAVKNSLEITSTPAYYCGLSSDMPSSLNNRLKYILR